MAEIKVSVYGGMFDSTSVESTESGFPKGNKAVDSEFFAKLLSVFYKNGIVSESSFKVVPKSGMSVTVTGGIAFVNGYMAWQKEDITVAVPGAGGYAVLLRLDTENGEFNLVCDDSFSAVTRDGNIYELLLATLSVPTGSGSVTESMITDKRSDTENCGYVTSAVDALSRVDTAENALNLGGSAADAYLKKSGGTMTGAIHAAPEGTGIGVVRNIAFGTSVPETLADGEMFVLISGE